jgi:mycofactocin system transcriptional regulator
MSTATAPDVPPVRPADGGSQPGRRRVTSQAELEQVAFELFAANGFEQTTVEDIAVAAGIGRRTFFRYFPSKNDVPWGMFEVELERMRACLKACPRDVRLMDAIRVALIEFNQVEPDRIRRHRLRMELILRVPALLAHSTLRFAAWRAVVAEFVAERTGQRPDALAPQAIAHAVLGVAVAAYEQWLDDENAELGTLLDLAMRHLAAAFTAPEHPATQAAPPASVVQLEPRALPPYEPSRMRSAAIQATAMVGAAVLPATWTGRTEASTTRSPVTPRTRSCGSTTSSASGPMAVAPTAW